MVKLFQLGLDLEGSCIWRALGLVEVAVGTYRCSDLPVVRDFWFHFSPTLPNMLLLGQQHIHPESLCCHRMLDELQCTIWETDHECGYLKGKQLKGLHSQGMEAMVVWCQQHPNFLCAAVLPGQKGLFSYYSSLLFCYFLAVWVHYSTAF